MTITIDLPPAVQAQAEKQATAAGLDLDTWLRHLAEVASQWPTVAVDRSRARTFEDEGFPAIERHPAIMDGEARVQEVRGDGVVGEQPQLAPGETYEYSSGTVLETPVGSMHGSYGMIDDAGLRFEAPIPAFTLAIPRVLH